MSDILIRDAGRADAQDIARVQVETWHATYRGMVPEDMLEAMTVEARLPIWQNIADHYEAHGTGGMLVAEVNGTTVGYGVWVRQRDEALRAQGYDGEIASLYVLPQAQGRGIGWALMRELARQMTARGYAAAALMVLTDNISSRAFYEACGGIVAGECIEDGLAHSVYGWRDLAALAG